MEGLRDRGGLLKRRELGKGEGGGGLSSSLKKLRGEGFKKKMKKCVSL